MAIRIRFARSDDKCGKAASRILIGVFFCSYEYSRHQSKSYRVFLSTESGCEDTHARGIAIFSKELKALDRGSTKMCDHLLALSLLRRGKPGDLSIGKKQVRNAVGCVERDNRKLGN
jgi:hypothetical protein